MTVEEILQALQSHDYPPRFAIAQWPQTACRFIRWSEEHEGFVVLAPVASNQGILVDPADVSLITDDLCSCGDRGCGWRDRD